MVLTPTVFTPISFKMRRHHDTGSHIIANRHHHVVNVAQFQCLYGIFVVRTSWDISQPFPINDQHFEPHGMKRLRHSSAETAQTSDRKFFWP
jgi:hypothetical protein